MTLTVSKKLCLLAAKSADHANASRNLWLPVCMHCVDTANMIEHLFLKASRHEQKCICNLDEDEAVKLVKFIGMTHDIGKMTPFFQAAIADSIPDLADRLAREQIFFCEQQKINHALAGEVILRKLDISEKICEIIGSHHGKPQDGYDVDKWTPGAYAKAYYNGNEALWRGLWEEWVAYSLAYAGYGSKSELPCKLSMPEQMLLTGLLIKADWIASDHKLDDLNKQSEKVRQEFYFRIDVPVRQWIESIDPNDTNTAIDDKCHELKARIAKIAGKYALELADAAGQSAIIGRYGNHIFGKTKSEKEKTVHYSSPEALNKFYGKMKNKYLKGGDKNAK